MAGLNLNWEVDLFGRLRNAAAAAGAQAQASAADFAAVQLSLQAELATDYFSLRGDDTTIQLLEDTIKVYDRAFELTRNRYKEGISAATDVDQADTLRQNARSQLAAVRLERAQLEHAIAVLLGKVPSGISGSTRVDLRARRPPLDAGSALQAVATAARCESRRAQHGGGQRADRRGAGRLVPGVLARGYRPALKASTPRVGSRRRATSGPWVRRPRCPCSMAAPGTA